MRENERETLPAGRPPWDTWNGARVGALAGGLAGVLVVALIGSGAYWLALIPAAIGAVIGYRRERGRRELP